MLLADQTRPHHLAHAFVAAQARVEPGVREKHRLGRYFQCRRDGVGTGVGQIDHDTQAIAFLDDVRPEPGEPAQVGRCRVDVPERHRSIAVMEQAQEAQAPLVSDFNALHLAFQEVASFHRLDDGRLAVSVSSLEVFEVQSPLHVIAGELCVHGGERVQKPIISDARLTEFLIIDSERRADRRQPRSPHLAREVEIRSRHVGCDQRHVDMVVRVDANGVGHDLRNSWINFLGRHEPVWSQQHGAAR